MTPRSVLCALVLVLCTHSVHAQWQNMPPDCEGRCWETDNEHPLARCAPEILENVITDAQADVLIASAEAYATQNGWTTKRHVQYSTTDLPMYMLGRESQVIMEQVWRRVGNDVKRRCGIDKSAKLTINDAFLVKYSLDQQPGLHRHRDGSFASFNVALSDPEFDYNGGGTRVWDCDEVAKNKSMYWKIETDKWNEENINKKRRDSDTPPRAGWVTYEPSPDVLLEEHGVLYKLGKTQMLTAGGFNVHEGVPVINGVRYIVAGFVGLNRHCCSLKYAGWRGVFGVLRVYTMGAKFNKDDIPLYDWKLYQEAEGWFWGGVRRTPYYLFLGLVAWKVFPRVCRSSYQRWRKHIRRSSVLPSKSYD